MFSSALIELVRQHPFLYDTSHKDNTNYKKKEVTWSEIGAQLGLPGIEAHHRWRALRDRYLYLRKYQNDPSKNGSKDATYFKYFDALSFLDEYFFVNSLKKRSSSRTIPKCWSKEHTLIFLRELKKNHLLYDQGHPYYLNRAQRHGALLNLTEKLRPYRPNLTPALIAHKIRIIRTQYAKEKRRMKDSPTYEPKLWCYDILSFLNEKGSYGTKPPHVREETEAEQQHEVEYRRSDEYEDVDYNDEPMIPFEEVEMDVYNQEQSQPVDHTEARDDLRSKCSRLLECLADEIKLMEAGGSNERVDWSNQSQQSILGLLVESELSNVSEEIYIETKWKIMHVLEEAARSNFKETSNSIRDNLQSTSVSTTSIRSSSCLRLEEKTTKDHFIYKTPFEGRNAYRKMKRNK